jgi:hypothetical protein
MNGSKRKDTQVAAPPEGTEAGTPAAGTLPQGVFGWIRWIFRMLFLLVSTIFKLARWVVSAILWMFSNVIAIFRIAAIAAVGLILLVTCSQSQDHRRPAPSAAVRSNAGRVAHHAGTRSHHRARRAAPVAPDASGE